jgi:hypothetical protein
MLSRTPGPHPKQEAHWQHSRICHSEPPASVHVTCVEKEDRDDDADRVIQNCARVISREKKGSLGSLGSGVCEADASVQATSTVQPAGRPGGDSEMTRTS